MRHPSLDALRAVAILLVFCYHSEGALLVSRFGWVGVDLFFVLSGFLVSGLLFREYQNTRAIRPGRFLLRRALKIYPQFYFFIAVMLAVEYTLGSPPRFWQAMAEIFFVQNYAPGMWSHTWSLGVEEHFYLLLTLIIAIFAQRGGANPFRALPGWIAASCLAILGLRTLTWLLRPSVTDYANVFPSHLRIDSLLIGVLLAYYHTFHGANLAGWMGRAGRWAPQASILLLSPVAYLTREHPFMVTLGFTLVSLGVALLLLSVLYPAKGVQVPSRAGRAMARLGQVSYAFYLWHAPILAAADALKPYEEARGIAIPLPANLLLTFGVCLCMAFATTRLIESPVLRWRDRRFPAKVNALPREAAVPELVTQTS